MIFGEYDHIGAKPKIKVIGVGGGGNNAIDHMIENHVGGVEFYAVNTDAQDLRNSLAEKKLLIGITKTHGQGAGAKPDVGKEAAIENEDDIHEMIGDAEMVFITCGMGGGTGTGAAPVIARIAREHGCLTVGFCTKPFLMEGPARMKNAIDGIEELKNYVDSLIVIPNENVRKFAGTDKTLLESFREADNVLRKGVQGISEIINVPGMINVDFADVKTVMQNKGTALMGIGVASGPNRAIEAARKAIHCSLAEVTIEGATNAIVNICASQNIAFFEVGNAIAEIRNNCGKDLNLIYGTAINNDLKDEMVVTVIATGYEMKPQSETYENYADEIQINIKESLKDSSESLDVIAPNLDPITTNSSSASKDQEIFGTRFEKEKTRKSEKEELNRQKVLEKEKKKEQKAEKSYPSWIAKIKKKRD